MGDLWDDYGDYGDDGGNNVIGNVGDGSNDYFGLTNDVGSAGPAATDTGISSWLDAINSGSKAISSTASAVRTMINPASAQVAQAKATGTGAGTPARSLFGGAFGQLNSTPMMLLLALGAYLIVARHL